MTDLIEEPRGNFYLKLMIDGEVQRQPLTKQQVRNLVRRGVNSSAFDEERMGRVASEMLKGDVSF